MTAESAPAEDMRMDVGALMHAVWVRLFRIAAVTVLLLLTTYGVLLFVPRLYESSASLLVEDRGNVYTEAPAAPTQQQSSGSGVTIDALISSQIELIKSRDTLLAVVDSLNLRSVPEFNGTASNPIALALTLIGHKPAARSLDDIVLQNLNDRLTVIRERDSAVISIYVRSADPQLAAKIANAIATEDVKRRAQQSVNDTKDASAWLEQQIDALRVKVQEADKKVADFKAENSIFAGANGTTLPDQQISDIGKQITDAQGVLNTARQHAELIRSLLKSGQPVDGVDDVRNSTVVQGLLQNRAALQSTFAEKSATLLPGHPTMVALKAQIAQVTAQINAEARHIADGLDAQVSVETGVIASLNNDLKRAQLAAATQTQDSVTLDSLTREAKAQRDLLDAYLLKYRDAAGRTDTSAVLPDVRVISQAAPSDVPASPKTALILVAVAGASLVLQIGAILFGALMSGRGVEPRVAEIGPVAPEEEASAPSAEVEDLDFGLDETVRSDFEPLEAEDEAANMQAPRRHAAGTTEVDLDRIRANIALGTTRIVLLAAIGDGRDAAMIADDLVRHALRQELSVCRVDAGSGRPSDMPGLSDLCAGHANYGDVVHKIRDRLAEVPWGTMAALDRRSSRPMTLVEALADIYEVVVISTGRVGLGSSLPLFAGAGGTLVMLHADDAPLMLVEAAATDAEMLGFEAVHSVSLPEPQAAVA